jgi:SOS-response transcriptional repressor LexA
MDIAQWVKAARTKAGISQEDLAAKLNLTKGNVSAWENRRHKPKLEQILEIHNLTGHSLPEEIGGSNVAPAGMGTVRIPLINYVQAGSWMGAISPFGPHDAHDWLMTDLELSGNAFALEIKGDSMLPDYKPGDRVIIDPAVRPKPGDCVVAKNGEHEAMFKKYRLIGINEQGGDIFELVPLNSDYPTIRSDVTPVQVIGTMMEHRKYRKP